MAVGQILNHFLSCSPWKLEETYSGKIGSRAPWMRKAWDLRLHHKSRVSGTGRTPHLYLGWIPRRDLPVHVFCDELMRVTTITCYMNIKKIRPCTRKGILDTISENEFRPRTQGSENVPTSRISTVNTKNAPGWRPGFPRWIKQKAVPHINARHFSSK